MCAMQAWWLEFRLLGSVGSTFILFLWLNSLTKSNSRKKGFVWVSCSLEVIIVWTGLSHPHTQGLKRLKTRAPIWHPHLPARTQAETSLASPWGQKWECLFQGSCTQICLTNFYFCPHRKIQFTPQRGYKVAYSRAKYMSGPGLRNMGLDYARFHVPTDSNFMTFL